MSIVRAYLSRALAALAVAVLTACGGGGGTTTPLPAAPHAPVGAASGTQIRITIPAPSSAGGGVRRAYVSPSTQSMSIGIAPANGCAGCSPNSTVVTTLGPSSQNCVLASGAYQCIVTVNLLPGSYTLNVTTFDGPIVSGAPTGQQLSINQVVPIAVSATGSNVVGLTLYGVPASVSVTQVSGTNASLLSRQLTIDVAGTARIAVTPLDVDRNAIVGPGAPTLSVNDNNTSGFGLTVNTNASTVDVAAPTTRYRKTDTLTFTLSGPGCTGNPVCTTIPSLTALETTFVGFTEVSGNDAYVYSPRCGCNHTLQSTFVHPTLIKFDDAGDAFVMDANHVYVFAYPWTAAPTVITAVHLPQAMAVDSFGDVFVADNSGVIKGFTPPYTSGAQVTFSAGLTAPTAVFVDRQNGLWMGDAGTGNVFYSATPLAGIITASASGFSAPEGFAQDTATGAVYLLETGRQQVDVFTPTGAASILGPYPVDPLSYYIASLKTGGIITSSMATSNIEFVGSSPTFITGSAGSDLDSDIFGNVYSASSAGVYEFFAPGYSPSGKLTIAAPGASPQGLAVFP